MTLSGASKVLTNQICDANGDNCLNIQDLNAGGNNGNLDVEGNHGQRCRYDCEGNDMASQSQCKIVCDQDKPSGGPSVNGTNGFICVKNGSNLDCNIDNNNLGGAGENTTTINNNYGNITSGTTIINRGNTTINNGPTTINGGDVTITGGTTNIYSGANVTVISGSNGGGGGSNWTKNGSTIYPTNTKLSVAIGTISSNNYTLNVNGSGRFATKLNVGDNFWILSGQRHVIYAPGNCNNTNNTRYATSPTIRYNGTLAFRDNDLLQCNNGYTEFGEDGRMGIGGPSETATKLSVYGHTRIYSNASATDQFIDLYHCCPVKTGQEFFEIIEN